MKHIPALALLSLTASIAAQPVVTTRGAPTLTIAGKTFRDLNRNGAIDPYEDWRRAPAARTADLVARMTLAEKAGVMMHGTLPGAGGGGAASIGQSNAGYDIAKTTDLIAARAINSFITRLSLPAADLARQNNRVQDIAARTRLGIPVTISTDPRNHFQYVLGASEQGGGFSQWPDPLGFGALGDPAAVRRFADIARQEYRAVGIHEALSPQADLATEPRWSRMTGTFGSSAARVSSLVAAYVEGFQQGRGGLGRDGVLTIVKHWVGYGAEPEGFDAHNHYGRVARLDDGSFADHVAAFRGAFAARVGGVMPTYPVIEGVTLGGRPLEPVGAGFNRQLLTDLLRGDMRYDGIILSDWAITRDCGPGCRAPTKPQTAADIAMPWGVEDVAEAERFAKGIDAGLDQFGGVERPDIVVAAVRAGRLSESRLDASVARVLMAKFRQGLFENPFVDEAAAARTVGRPRFTAAAADVQRRAQVLLENRDTVLPLRRGTKIWVHGLSPQVARAHGLAIVASPAEADVAVLRMAAPHEMLHPNHFFGSRQHEGRLDFRAGDADYDALLQAAAAGKPVVVSIYLDRPAILTNVRDKAAAIVANFGVSDGALLDVLTGRARAEGRMPFELPSSMAAVERQDPAIPNDSLRPLYPLGAGLVDMAAEASTVTSDPIVH